MIFSGCIFGMMSLILTGSAFAADPAKTSQKNDAKSPVNIVISQSIVNRQPTDENLRDDDQFKLVGSKLYAWTKLNEKVDTPYIHHVWYFQDRRMDDIRLPLRAQYGRLYSVKTILKPYIGVWRLEVETDDHRLLETRYFQVELIRGELYATVMERGFDSN